MILFSPPFVCCISLILIFSKELLTTSVFYLMMMTIIGNDSNIMIRFFIRTTTKLLMMFILFIFFLLTIRNLKIKQKISKNSCLSSYTITYKWGKIILNLEKINKFSLAVCSRPLSSLCECFRGPWYNIRKYMYNILIYFHFNLKCAYVMWKKKKIRKIRFYTQGTCVHWSNGFAFLSLSLSAGPCCLILCFFHRQNENTCVHMYLCLHSPIDCCYLVMTMVVMMMMMIFLLSSLINFIWSY